MSTIRSMLFSFVLSTSAATAVAQGNHVTIGVTPGQTTSGLASDGSAGALGVTIGGFGTVPVNVPAGTDSQGIATAAAQALTAQGFAVTQNGTSVTVTAGPGGAPLLHGGGIGSTDTGVTGVGAEVEPAPGQPPVAGGPAVKRNGGQVRKAAPQQQAQANGDIQVDVEVQKLVNGQWTLLWIQVVVPVLPGDDGQAINDRVRQQLEQQGLRVNDITLPPVVAPLTPVPPGCFGLDRTVDGGAVQFVSVGVHGGAGALFGAVEVGAGQAPDAGATDYDRSIDAAGGATGDHLAWTGDPTIGNGGAFEAFVLPNQFGLWVIGNGPGGLLQAPLLPIPQVGPGFDMPLDPMQALLFAGISDPLGHMGFPLPIPPAPNLTGLELQTAAVTLDPFGATLFDGARRTNGLTLRIGN